MTAFLIVGAIGLVMLAISLLLGDFLDAIDGFDLGATSLGAALTVFGVIGLVVNSAVENTWVAVVAGLVAGALAAFLAQRAVRVLEASSDGDPTYDLVGLEGSLTATTGPTSGQVRLDDPREVESRLAWSDRELSPGTRVRVIGQSGSRAKVEPV